VNENASDREANAVIAGNTAPKAPKGVNPHSTLFFCIGAAAVGLSIPFPFGVRQSSLDSRCRLFLLSHAAIAIGKRLADQSSSISSYDQALGEVRIAEPGSTRNSGVSKSAKVC